MVFFNKRLSELTINTSNSLKPTFKKAAISAIVLGTLTFGVSTASASSSNLSTVYYVYMDKEYVGTVSDKEVVEDILEGKVEEFKQSYTNYDLAVDSQLTYVSEQVFNSSAKTNDKEVAEIIQNKLAVQANAAALVIDGKAVAYLKSEAEADQVLNALKLKYVTQEQLTELEARKETPEEALPPLTENQVRLLDVSFTKEVSQNSEKVTPDKILTVDQAVNFLTKGTLEEKKYQVKEGDVLGGIASENGMEMAQLLSINPGLTEDSVLKIGQELNVTFLQPLLQVVVVKEEMKKEVIAFESKVIEDPSMYKGDTEVEQEGSDGSSESTYKVTEQNGVRVAQEVVSQNILQEPVSYIVRKGTKVVPSRGDGSLAWPTNGGYVSSQMGFRWGKQHKGIDIARPSNPTIKAADNGVIVSAGYDNGYGNKIIIDHNNGMRTVYAHLASINVSVGQTVIKGSSIGVMGSTGDSTGVHLHFEVYQNGSLKDPLSLLNR
jgi:murein DD-endopeptidase MepM/ murein hydrolase activator NlpD